MIQGTPEWFAERLGKATASRMADIMATTKSGYGASRANYMAELLVERLTGAPLAGFTNSAMQWGVENEPLARAAYEFMTDRPVVEVGFVPHPTIVMSGASPDGLVGDDGMVEIKCPLTATHVEMLLTERVPDKYKLQMAWQMVCADRAWCDFVSFDPRLPAPMQLYVWRFHRDPIIDAKLDSEVRLFLAELDGKEAALIGKFQELAA